MDEIRLLQNIIARHEDYSFRIKGWFAAIVGGLAAGLYLKDIPVDWITFMAVGTAVYASFVVWLLYHRVIIRRAINRVKTIEEGWLHPLDSNREGGSSPPDDEESEEGSPPPRQTGSRLVASLSAPIKWSELFSRQWDPQIHVPIAVGLVLMTVLVLFAPDHAKSKSIDNTDGPGVTDQNEPRGSSKPSSGGDGGDIDTQGKDKPPGPGAGSRPTEPVIGRPTDLTLPLTLLFVVAGGAMVLLGRGWIAKTAGALTVLGALNIVVIKELKIERILDIKFGTQTREVPHVVVAYNDAAHFGAQYLGGVVNFRIGRSEIDESGFETPEQLSKAKDSIKQIC